MQGADFNPMYYPLLKMMEASNKTLLTRLPQLTYHQRIVAQRCVMDEFINIIAPLIKTKEDLEAFITIYKDRAPIL